MGACFLLYQELGGRSAWGSLWARRGPVPAKERWGAPPAGLFHSLVVSSRRRSGGQVRGGRMMGGLMGGRVGGRVGCRVSGRWCGRFRCRMCGHVCCRACCRMCCRV